MEGWANAEAESNPSILPLYLGLFLTLLAFFIMFLGISLPDRSWPASTSGGSGEATAVTGSDADKIALSAIAGAFRQLGATMAGAPADAITGLDVSVPARSLYADHTAAIRPAAIAALDRAATSLAAPRGDNRLVLRVTIGFGSGGEATATAIRRAAGLAAALLQRGAPPDAFIAETAPLATGDVHFHFRLVDNQDDLGAAF